MITGSHRLIKNTLFNISGIIWVGLAGLILTPYIVATIGPVRYGVWIIILTLAGYFGLFDMSLRNSYVKFIAEYHARADSEGIRQVVSTGFFFSLIISALIMSIAILFYKPVLGFFNMSDSNFAEAKFVLLGSIFLFAITNTFSVYEAVLIGLQRLDIINIVNILASIPKIVLIILLLKWGYGLKGLLYANGSMVLLTTFIIVIMAYRLLPKLGLRFFNFNKETFRTLFNYGIKLQGSSIAGMINLQTDRILLGHFLNMPMVTFYELGMKISLFIRQIPSMLFSAMVPAASELSTINDKRRINILFIKSSRYITFMTFPMMIFMIVVADIFMNLWMGRGYEISANVLRILIVGYGFNMTIAGAVAIARGIGIVHYELKSSLLVAIANLVFGIILIQIIGIYGAAIATFTSVVLGSIYFLCCFKRHMQILLRDFAKGVYQVPFFSCLFSGVIVSIVNYLITKSGFSFSRIDFLSILLVDFIIFTGIYLYGILRFQYIDKEDINIFRSYFSKK